LGSGPEGAGGQDSVKYVGGVQRTYSGVSGKTMLLEVVLRPPIGDAGKDGDGRLSSDIEPLPPEDVLMDGLDEVQEIPLEEEEEKPPKELPREKPVTKTTVVQEWENPRPRQLPRDMPLPEPTIPLSEFVPVEDEVFMEDEEFMDGGEFLVEDDLDFVRNDVIFEDELFDDEYEGEIIYEDEFVDDRFDDRVPYRKEGNFIPQGTGKRDVVVSEQRILDEDDFDEMDEETEEETEAEDDDDEEETISLSTKMGLTFKRIGGLDDQLDSIVRRVLSTR
jgi:hypothetical protein